MGTSTLPNTNDMVRLVTWWAQESSLTRHRWEGKIPNDSMQGSSPCRLVVGVFCYPFLPHFTTLKNNEQTILTEGNTYRAIPEIRTT